MCLVVLAWNAHPRYRLIVAANRDEFHNRPAAALAPWREPPLLAGRDLEAGGTWLGVDRGRRFGVVTNYREMMRRPADAPSRGALITDWLSRGQDTARFSTALAASALPALRACHAAQRLSHHGDGDARGEGLRGRPRKPQHQRAEDESERHPPSRKRFGGAGPHAGERLSETSHGPRSA